MSLSFAKVSLAGLGVAFLLLLALQLHNVMTYPMLEGFDAPAHLLYIDYLKEYKQLPVPHEGWETSQQPLYYIVGSLWPAVISLKWIGFWCWVVLCLVMWRFLWHVLRSAPLTKRPPSSPLLALAVFCISIAIPVVVALTPTISNEFFTTMMISVSLWYYVTHFVPTLTGKQAATSKKMALLLGIILGLTLLSKATTAVLIIAIVLERVIANYKRPLRAVQQLWLPLSVAFLVGGWLYLRNTLVYGSPFFSVPDFVPLEMFDAAIVPRDLTFFFSPVAFFTLDFFKGHDSSFLAGTFFSWFYDGHGGMLPLQESSKAGTVVVLFGGLWFFIALAGFLKAVMNGLKHRHFVPTSYLLLYIYAPLLALSHAYYNIKLPIFSTVKGAFISSLIVPFAYFLYRGLSLVLEKVPAKYKTPAIMGVVSLACGYVLLITKHFWVQQWWY